MLYWPLAGSYTSSVEYRGLLLGAGAATVDRVAFVGSAALVVVVDCIWFSRWNLANSAAKSICPGRAVVKAGAGEGEKLGAGLY